MIKFNYMKTVLNIGFLLSLLLITLRSAGCPFHWKDSTPMNATILTSFPITVLTGGVILLKAALNNQPDSLIFILDTGSGGISLDSTTAATLQVPVSTSNKRIRGLGGINKLYYARKNCLKFPGLATDSLDFHINDYALLSSVYGIKIDGIIGFSLFSRYIIAINYDNATLCIYTKGKYIYPESGFYLHAAVQSLPVVEAELKNGRNESRAQYYFDTGAGLCLLLSEEFVRDSLILDKKRKPVLTHGAGLGGKILMRLSVIKQFKIGTVLFNNVPVYIFDDVNRLTSYPHLAGLIGNDLLRRFNVVFNYEEQLFHLSPNTHFNEQFDYAFTGLGIYFVHNRIVIEEVVAHSPAAQAGFLPGDIITGVANKINGTIMEYKALLQETSKKTRIIINRGGELMELYLKPRNILRRK